MQATREKLEKRRLFRDFRFLDPQLSLAPPQLLRVLRENVGRVEVGKPEPVRSGRRKTSSSRHTLKCFAIWLLNGRLHLQCCLQENRGIFSQLTRAVTKSRNLRIVLVSYMPLSNGLATILANAGQQNAIPMRRLPSLCHTVEVFENAIAYFIDTPMNGMLSQ